MRHRFAPLLVLLVALLGGRPATAQSPAEARAAALGAGMNVSWLEQYWLGTPTLADAPLWPAEFETMKRFGFQSVRLPIVFDVFADTAPPYAIDPAIWTVLDDIVAATRGLDLMLVLDNHHGQLYDTTFEAELPRHVAILAQLATRYGDTDPDRVLFELYNEPHDLSNENWHTFLRAAIDTMRQAAPDHTLIYGGIDYNGVEGLLQLDPALDDNVIYALHTYEPLLFTHQGAPFLAPASATTGVPFPYDADRMPPLAPEAVGTEAEPFYDAYPVHGTAAYLRGRFDTAVAWGQANRVPLWLGEFGTYKFFADTESRVAYTRVLADAAIDAGIPYAYWEWDDGFGVFDGDGSIPTNPDDVNGHLLSALGVVVVGTAEDEVPGPTSLVAYPNPSAGRLVLEGTRLGSVTVFDVLGRAVSALDGYGASRLNVTLPTVPGVYVLRAETAGGVATTRATRR